MRPALFADMGDALAWGLLALMVVGIIACLLAVAPLLMAIPHGWRWTAAMAIATAACGMPLRVMFDADDIAGEAWGLVSLPLWVVLAIVARRGPPNGSFLQSTYDRQT